MFLVSRKEHYKCSHKGSLEHNRNFWAQKSDYSITAISGPEKLQGPEFLIVKIAASMLEETSPHCLKLPRDTFCSLTSRIVRLPSN